MKAPTKFAAKGVLTQCTLQSQLITVLVPSTTSSQRFQSYRRFTQGHRLRSENSKHQDSDLAKVFAEPSWSVRSLLSTSSPSPSPNTSQGKSTNISPKTLHHLLRLSALPPPASEAEEKAMLSILETQLHFVRDIQTVDTNGIQPLPSIRDETGEGLSEMAEKMSLVLDSALKQEVKFGFHKRPRRVVGRHARGPVDLMEQVPEEAKVGQGEDEMARTGAIPAGRYENEEALVEMATKARKERGYFVVKGGKAKRGE